MTELKLNVFSKMDFYYGNIFDLYKLSKNTVGEIKICFGLRTLSFFIKSPTDKFIFYTDFFPYRIYKNGKPDFEDIINNFFNQICYYFVILNNQDIKHIYSLCLERLRQENDFEYLPLF